jgi:hypothetical protein
MDIIINADIDSIPECTSRILTQGNFYHNILSCLGYPKQNPPVADLLRRYHQLDGDWMIASPVHWEATHNDAMIIASGHQLEYDETESRCWFEAFKEFITPLNMRLHYHDAYTWLLQAEQQPLINAKPVHALHHQSMMPELQQLDTTFFWQRFFTENQMFFSAHALNKTRTGLYPINGVWIWGAGTLGAKVPTPLISENRELLELATFLSINVSDSYGLLKDIKKSVVLCNDLNQNDYSALQKKLQKYSVCWYWNNEACQSKPKSWISRLMGKM